MRRPILSFALQPIIVSNAICILRKAQVVVQSLNMAETVTTALTSFCHLSAGIVLVNSDRQYAIDSSTVKPIPFKKSPNYSITLNGELESNIFRCSMKSSDTPDCEPYASGDASPRVLNALQVTTAGQLWMNVLHSVSTGVKGRSGALFAMQSGIDLFAIMGSSGRETFVPDFGCP